LAVDTKRREVRVEIKRETCSCEIEPFIEALKETLGVGAKTVYEIPSIVKDDVLKVKPDK